VPVKPLAAALGAVKKFFAAVEPDMDFLVIAMRVEAGMTPHPPTVPVSPAN